MPVFSPNGKQSSAYLAARHALNVAGGFFVSQFQWRLQFVPIGVHLALALDQVRMCIEQFLLDRLDLARQICDLVIHREDHGVQVLFGAVDIAERLAQA